MSNLCPITCSIERFAERIGMGNGAMRFPVHQGDLFVADVIWRELIPMDPATHEVHHSQRKESWSDIRVPEDLKQLIVEKVGQFGGIEAEFVHGEAVKCVLYVHLIPDRRQKRR